MDFPDYVDPDDMDINCKEWELSGLRVVQSDAPVAQGALFPTARIQVLKIYDEPKVEEYSSNWPYDQYSQPLASYERRVDHFNGEYEDWRKI